MGQTFMDYLLCSKSWANFLHTSSAFYQFLNVTHVLEPSLNYDRMTTARYQKNSLFTTKQFCALRMSSLSYRSLSTAQYLVPWMKPPPVQQGRPIGSEAAFLPVWWCCLLPAGRWPGECFHGTLDRWMRSLWGRWPDWRPPPCQGGTEPRPGSSPPCSWSWTRNLPLGRWNIALINHNQSS